MISRLYIHNYGCLDDFELLPAGQPSVLLIGRNGAGKSTVGAVLELLQRIARGTNRIGELVGIGDFTRGRRDVPMRFEVEATIGGSPYRYSIALELPPRFRELRVLEERLSIGGRDILMRDGAEVRLARAGEDRNARFALDWHLAALPVVQEQSEGDPISIFRLWLANLLVLRPMPALMKGETESETTRPDAALTEFGAWFSGLVAAAPSVYATIDRFLKQVMPDLQDIQNPRVGRESRSLTVQFTRGGEAFSVPFESLSDGEKCFAACALVLAAKEVYQPLVCFWDEPDNYLAPSEIGFVTATLRRAFRAGGQLVVTSHNPEAIRRFSDENTFAMLKGGHLEPAVARTIGAMRAEGRLQGNLSEALLRGDITA